MIRLATADDIGWLLEIAERFISETSYDIVYDPEAARNHLLTYIHHSDADILLADGGGAMVAASREFQKQPFCYVGKFFVIPESRRTGTAREIVEAILAWASLHGCSHVFVTATAGLAEREQRLFINLMKRYGFIESGPVLFRGV